MSQVESLESSGVMSRVESLESSRVESLESNQVTPVNFTPAKLDHSSRVTQVKSLGSSQSKSIKSS